tara:strand:- start:22482 stop:23381 length:900 start_codon:yes stop_codon:yes gene_type:complete
MAGPATGFLIAGLALSAGSAAFSFGQAGAAKRAQRDAESKADAMMLQARKRLDINYMEELSIKKEPYELQREALLQQGATALAAAQEGDQRGVAAAAGRLQQAQNQAQGGVRTAMGQEQAALEKAVAMEESRLRDLNVQLDLGEIAGAQSAAADSEAKAAAAMNSGVQAAGSAVQQGIQLGADYRQDNKLQKAALSNTELSADELATIGDLDLQAIGSMSNRDFRQFKRGLTDQQSTALFGSQGFQTQYNLGLTQNQNTLEAKNLQNANAARLADLQAKQTAGTITAAELTELTNLLNS